MPSRRLHWQSMSASRPEGLRNSLASDGCQAFAPYSRKALIKAMSAVSPMEHRNFDILRKRPRNAAGI